MKMVWKIMRKMSGTQHELSVNVVRGRDFPSK